MQAVDNIKLFLWPICNPNFFLFYCCQTMLRGDRDNSHMISAKFWTHSTLLSFHLQNSCNLISFVGFFGTPSPHPLQISYVYAITVGDKSHPSGMLEPQEQKKNFSLRFSLKNDLRINLDFVAGENYTFLSTFFSIRNL